MNRLSDTAFQTFETACINGRVWVRVYSRANISVVGRVSDRINLDVWARVRGRIYVPIVALASARVSARGVNEVQR